MKIQNLYLVLAVVCCVMLCVLSPAYFTSEQDPTHFFTMDFMHISAKTYNVEGQLISDNNFSYSVFDEEKGEVVGKVQSGAAIMSIWGLPILAIIMGLVALVDIIWGFFATKVSQIVVQANLNIITLVCVVGYYAMLAMYIFFCVMRFDFDWHLSWPSCLPLVIFILTIMAMNGFAKNAKKIRRDLSGSIR